MIRLSGSAGAEAWGRCQTMSIPLASIGPAARLSREALVSFSYNFQNVRTIEKAPANHGIRGVFRDNTGPRGAIVALIAARHDLVHMSVPVRFNMRASCHAVAGLALGIAGHLAEHPRSRRRLPPRRWAEPHQAGLARGAGPLLLLRRHICGDGRPGDACDIPPACAWRRPRHALCARRPLYTSLICAWRKCNAQLPCPAV